MNVPSYRLQKLLYVYASPIIVVVGLFGNIMSMLVLSGRPMRRVSTYCYLAVSSCYHVDVGAQWTSNATSVHLLLPGRVIGASPIIVVVGLFGNIMSMLVLSGRPMRRVSTYCYLAVLSVVDSLVLGVGLLPKWLDEVT